MADAMSQDSDTGLTAEQLDAKYGESQDAARTPPKDDDDTPAHLRMENHPSLVQPAGPPANNPAAAAPGAVAALMPIRSESSQLVEQMGAAVVSAASAAPPDNGLTGPSQSGAPGGKPGDEDGDASSSTDDSDDDELTPEEKEKAELVKNINEVIARAKAQGYTFSKGETTAAAAFLDAKELFDQADQDITDCANDKKKITISAVTVKVTELRAAEQASLVVVDTTASQLQLGDDDSDEEEEEEQQFNPHKDKTLAQIKPLLIDAKGDNPNPLTL